MRKCYAIAVAIFGLSLLLIGCGKADNNDFVEDAEKIEVASVDNPETVLSTLEEPLEIVDFINKLEIHKWVLADIPSTANESFMYKLYRPETEKLLDRKSKEQELQIITIITVYQNEPYLKVETKLLDVTFKVPKDVAEYLNKF